MSVKYSKGWFAVTRGWRNNDIFEKQPFSEHEAWLWLMENAVFVPKAVVVKNKIYSLNRGQQTYALRFLGEAWQWDKNKVHRFLKKLEKFDFIETKAGTRQTVITICDYDGWQHPLKNLGTNYGTDGETKTGQTWDNRGTNNNTSNIFNTSNNISNTRAYTRSKYSNEAAADLKDSTQKQSNDFIFEGLNVDKKLQTF